MSPKEKAKELVNKFMQYSNAYKWTANVASREIVIVDIDEQLKNAIQCALIAVDEIINVIGDKNSWEESEFWEEVITEIQAL